jgi:hypothetical protein
MKGDRERCLEAGMDDFLGKPIRRRELFAAIERVLAVRGPESDSSTGPGVAPPGSADPWPLLDAATLLTACDGDGGLLARMVAVFRSGAPGQLERVATALRDRDAGALRESAHKLCGLVSAFSTTAADAARRLEHAGADRNLDGTESVYTSLSDTMRDLTSLLDKLTVAELRSRLPRS